MRENTLGAGCDSQLASCLLQVTLWLPRSQLPEHSTESLAEALASLAPPERPNLSCSGTPGLLKLFYPYILFHSKMWLSLFWRLESSHFPSLTDSFLPSGCTSLLLQAQFSDPFSVWSSYPSCAEDGSLLGGSHQSGLKCASAR